MCTCGPLVCQPTAVLSNQIVVNFTPTCVFLRETSAQPRTNDLLGVSHQSVKQAFDPMHAFLTASTRRIRTRRNVWLAPTDVFSRYGGGHWREGGFELLLLLLHPRGLSTATPATGGAGGGGGGVRKRMMPLIKLVHPDMFAQYPSDVASTNSKSLKV